MLGVELFDVETQSVQKVTIAERNLRQYRAIFRAHQDSVATYCRSRGLGCTQSTTEAPFEDLILRMMRTAGAVR